MSEHNHSNATDGYEKLDVDGRDVIPYIILTVVIIGFMMGWISNYFYKQQRLIESDVMKKTVSVVRMESAAKDAKILKDYAILDKENQVYRIPLDRAIKILTDEAYKNQPKEGDVAMNTEAKSTKKADKKSAKASTKIKATKSASKSKKASKKAAK